ncbi:MAG: hypothetical protein AB7S72_17940 [Draconibacterium sp.]
MSKLKYTILVVIVLCLTENTSAQFSLTGEFRPRTEFNHGYKSLAYENQDLSTITSQRTRLNALFSNEFVKTKLVLQDVRNWGNQAQLVGNENYATSVHEAWAEVFFVPEFSLQAGRQELNYDDQRIFGNVGWTQQGRTHDVALLKYKKNFTLHFGIAHHENSDITNNIYDGPDAYKDLQFLWFNKAWKANSLSLLALNNGVPVMEDSVQVSKYSQTLGGRVTRKFEKLSVAANLYYQTGKHSNGKEISALNFLAEATLKMGITAGYEYLSGNSYNKNDKVYAFTPFYGTNHKFNGFMDYFYVSNHINSVGLNDAYLKYGWSKKKFSVNADLHYFASAGKISEDADKYLGTEIDLTFGYKLHEIATLNAGLSSMFASETMELLKGGDSGASNYWAYVMLTVTPAFIK